MTICKPQTPRETNSWPTMTCQFRDKSELRDWIVACTLRLMEDIKAKEEEQQEATQCSD